MSISFSMACSILFLLLQQIVQIPEQCILLVIRHIQHQPILLQVAVNNFKSDKQQDNWHVDNCSSSHTGTSTLSTKRSSAVFLLVWGGTIVLATYGIIPCRKGALDQLEGHPEIPYYLHQTIFLQMHCHACDETSSANVLMLCYFLLASDVAIAIISTLSFGINPLSSKPHIASFCILAIFR